VSFAAATLALAHMSWITRLRSAIALSFSATMFSLA
jgi:hypothetical protein